MRQDLKYLYRIASNFVEELEVFALIDQGVQAEGSSFMRIFSAYIEERLKKWTPERLGGLAALGRGYDTEVTEEEWDGSLPYVTLHRCSLRDVHLEERLTDSCSGYTLLRRIAALTVVAAMLDLARARLRK